MCVLNSAIGVYGGQFAPVHHGHLRLAIEARERLGLARVHLIPTSQPALRAAPAIPAERRLHWLRLAVAHEAGLEADGRELRRRGVSYTVDTLAELRAEHPDAPLVLLLGADAAAQLHRWQRWRELPDFAHLVFFARPAASLQLAPEVMARLAGREAAGVGELSDRPAGRWLSLPLPALEISSTRIRRLLAAGRSIGGLVPAAVIQSLTHEDVLALTENEYTAAD